jgi:hypothetical protein
MQDLTPRSGQTSPQSYKPLENNEQIDLSLLHQTSLKTIGGHAIAKEAEEWSGTEFDIPEDAYGAAILAIVKDLATIVEGKGNILVWTRFVFPMLLLVVNLALQSALLWYILNIVVEPAVAKVQHHYFNFHAECFHANKTFRPDVWHNWRDKAPLCSLAMTKKTFLYTLLLIWILRMLIEMIACQRFVMDIIKMPHCTRSVDQIVHHIHGSYIVAMTRLSRTACYLLVCVPKFAISLALMALGCRWLQATITFQKLVLNTLAMEFIIHIDELLFDALVPVAYREQVQHINFFVKHPPKKEETIGNEECLAWKWSIFYTFVALVCVFLWGSVFQTILPRFIDDIGPHCTNFTKSLEVPVCDKYFNLKSCYPFGKQDTTGILVNSSIARLLYA